MAANKDAISRRDALQGAGAAALAGLMPEDAVAQAVQTPAPQLLSQAAQIVIANNLITATVYPPGKTGFYQGTRFDHTGIVGSLKLKGKEFYGPWFDAVQDDIPDFRWVDGKVVTGRASSIMGPAEEFDPVGFDSTAPGDVFLLPGVGLLIRPDSEPYNHFRHYERRGDYPALVDSVNRDENKVITSQNVFGGGYGYRYEKTLALPADKPQLIISHVLRNTGTRPITSSVYDHNFITLNPGQADMRVTLPFAPPQPAPQSRLAVNGNSITWPQALAQRQAASMTLSETPQPYDFTTTDTKTGASVRAQADVPASQFRLWSIRTVMAVEPYVAINVAPGAEQRWSYTYTYSAP